MKKKYKKLTTIAIILLILVILAGSVIYLYRKKEQVRDQNDIKKIPNFLVEYKNESLLYESLNLSLDQFKANLASHSNYSGEIREIYTDSIRNIQIYFVYGIGNITVKNGFVQRIDINTYSNGSMLTKATEEFGEPSLEYIHIEGMRGKYVAVSWYKEGFTLIKNTNPLTNQTSVFALSIYIPYENAESYKEDFIEDANLKLNISLGER